MVTIENDIKRMLDDNLIGPENRDTAKLLLVAINFGCSNVGKLSAISGLPRDSFVTPRARRLKEQGIWTRDGVAFEYPDGPPEFTNTEFAMHILAAEGMIRRSVTPKS